MIRSDILQNDLKVEGEFVTEEVLREEWKWSETLIHRLVKSKLWFFYYQVSLCYPSILSLGFWRTLSNKPCGWFLPPC